MRCFRVFLINIFIEYGWNPSRNGHIKLHLSKYLDFHSFGMACFVTPVTPLYWNWSQNTTQNTTTTNGFGIPVLVLPVVVSNWRDNQSIKLSIFVSYSRLLMIGDMPTLILERNDYNDRQKSRCKKDEAKRKDIFSLWKWPNDLAFMDSVLL